jgi:CheY-like chemotaxis protein
MMVEVDGELSAGSRSTGRRGLPCAEPRSSSDQRRDAAQDVRILVVEDQPDVRQMLATALELEGHRVDQAGSALEGLDRLASTHYDLVLSDYAMPDRTGLWMLDEAGRRGFLRHTQALIVTAHPDVRGLEAVHVLTKPLDLDRFLDFVRRLLDDSTCDSTAS